jgi:hypothetical protein
MEGAVMKRLALLLVAVGLGSGCIIESTPNLGSAAIYWSFWNSDKLGNFGSTSSTATEVCAAAGVDGVDITLTSPSGVTLPVSTGPCKEYGDVPGTVFLDLDPGTWDYYIAGYRGSALVFQDSGTFSVSNGNETVVDTLLTAIHKDVEIVYTTATCPTGGSIEFDLYDSVHVNPVYSTYAGTPNPAVAVPCAATASMVIPSVAAGVYDFSPWVQYDSTGTPVRYSTCKPTWTQSATASKTITVDLSALTSPTTFCSFDL